MNLWKVAIRHYTHHPWQILLSVIGIALGVAVVVAIDLANSSASKAFELSSTAVTGAATHQIVGGPDHIDEQLYSTLRAQAGLELIAPIVEGYGQFSTEQLPEGPTLHILGVDIFADMNFRTHIGNTFGSLDVVEFLTNPKAAILLDTTAAQYGLALGDEFYMTVRGIKYLFETVGLVRTEDSMNQQALQTIVIVDIATAQEILGMQGRLSQIDVQLPEGEAESIKQRILSHLPENASLVSANARTHALSQLSNAFQTNLTALSLLALFVGLFLIYNTMIFSVIQRREILGYLRTLGVTRSEIFKLIYVEAGIIGLIATVLGVFIGILLGSGLLHLVTRTINDLYFVVTVNELNISNGSIIKGMILGMAATLAAVFIPAYEATKSTTRNAFSRSAMEISFLRTMKVSSWVGYVLLLVGLSILYLLSDSLPASFAALFIIVLGFALLVPIMTLALLKMLTPLMRALFGELGNIFTRGVLTSFSRSGVAITALSIAVATSIGVTVMIDSFRNSVVVWLDATLQADIYVAPDGIASDLNKGGLSMVWVDRFKQIEEIKDIGVSRRVQIYTKDELVQILAVNMPRRSFSKFRIIEGDQENAMNDFFDNDAVLISESFAFHHKLTVADHLMLPTDQGEHLFKIAGVYTDYGSERGVVAMNRKTYLRYWNDKSISSLAVYVKRDDNIATVMKKMQEIVDKELANPYKLVKEQRLLIRSNEVLREGSIRIFDRTFAVTQVLRLLAIIVAFVGILSALMAIHIEKSREIALLRTIGLTPRQVWFVISGESGLIGGLAGILAIPLGLALAAILIVVINRRSFGWSMDITLEPMVLFQSVFLAVVAALLAGAFPAARISRVQPADALREE
ncbi:MAG: ABC transporter permease [Gammaproteobacteria bacterium]|nr:ABC transporter permease [Gammaproteobacteria bacterium]MDH5800976.1 ABC transporter permease [Gammaproteobacteria bacterium]